MFLEQRGRVIGGDLAEQGDAQDGFLPVAAVAVEADAARLQDILHADSNRHGWEGIEVAAHAADGIHHHRLRGQGQDAGARLAKLLQRHLVEAADGRLIEGHVAVDADTAVAGVDAAEPGDGIR